jgi:hypothetical protein
MSSQEPKADPEPPEDRIAALITECLRVHLKREPLPEEIGAAMEHQRKSLAEYASPSAARIEAAADANKLNDAAPASGSSGFHDCKAPAQWTEPPRPKHVTSADDLNRAARTKWDKWTAQIADFEEKHPERATKAARRAARLIADGQINNPELAAETSYTGAIIEAVGLIAGEASRAALSRAKKPRPKKRPTHRNNLIAAMRHFRAEGHTFNEFLAAAEDSIEGLSIDSAESGVKRFVIECGAAGETARTVALKTLSEWWSVAGKGLNTPD